MRRNNKKGSGRAATHSTHLSRSLSMDILPEHDALVADTPSLLSYEQDVAYEDQVQAAPTPPSLADRISRNKVYLLSESSVNRGSKVRPSQCH
jgi:hypothetical protein